MRIHRFIFGVAAFILCGAAAAFASPIEYQVVVDTSSVAGTAGSLDFNFNPGPIPPSQQAFVDLLNFTTDGTVVGPASPSGDVSGTLPATVTFGNPPSPPPFGNDYFEDFNFGSSLSFFIKLYGPALDSPDGTSTSGSRFSFSMFSDQAGTTPALTTDAVNGFATLFDVNLDGTTTVTNLSDQTTVTAVPEPASLVLIGSGAIGLWVRRRGARI